MAKETQIVLWCDGPHEERVQGDETIRISIDGPVKEIDLCLKCAEELIDPLSLIVAQGQPVEDAPRTKSGKRPSVVYGDFVCPECNQKLTTKQGLGVHRSRAHGVPGATVHKPRPEGAA